jgi:hypothetical protein
MAGPRGRVVPCKLAAGMKSTNLDGYSAYREAVMAKKAVKSLILILGVIGAASLLPDFIRYMKIRSM